MLSGTESADVQEPGERIAEADANGAVSAAPASGGPGPTSEGLSELSRPLRAATSVAVALCLALSLVHVLMVFLHITPSSRISQAYSKQINGWVYPLFEQNWRLFAPEPESVNRQISVRTKRTAADGTVEVSDWFDLTAVDNAAVRHNPFPSHTSQNMLRRAWTSYVESHGSDDQSRTERAVMLRKYLRNIAAERVAAHRRGTFDSIQLRVITLPITAATGASGTQRTPPAPLETRYLPWWKAETRAN